MFQPNQMGIYIHWPFCESRCPYCDFNAHVREDLDQDIWADAYVKALDYYKERLPDNHVVSLFFGGGTPSLMTPETVAKIIDKVQASWKISNDIEITLEANPTSVEQERFKGFQAAGVNRISLGVQALNEQDLKFLGRKHSLKDALTAIELSQEYFDKSSFDLIYARPKQTLEAWEDELKYALSLGNKHLSLYQLTIERNTPFYMRHERGEFSVPDDVHGAELYLQTQNIMEEQGLPAYEVSNHAFCGHECRHNQIYWYMADYIGVGAGAHGRFIMDGQKYATRDHAAPEIWLERVNERGVGSHEPEILDANDRFDEAFIMGLRLRNGIAVSHLQSLSGVDFDTRIESHRLKEAKQNGWVLYDRERISLTREGLLRLNALVPYLLKT